MAGNLTRSESLYDIGRYLTIKDDTLLPKDEVRPDWFKTPLTRDELFFHEEVKLVLVETRYLKRVKLSDTGAGNVTDYITAPVDGGHEHVLIIPAGAVAKILPDFSFFISNVAVKRHGVKFPMTGQATFFPPKPSSYQSHHHERERLSYSIALRVYSGSRF